MGMKVPELGFSGLSRKEAGKHHSQMSEVALGPAPPQDMRLLCHGTLHWPPGLLLANCLVSYTECRVLTKRAKHCV